MLSSIVIKKTKFTLLYISFVFFISNRSCEMNTEQPYFVEEPPLISSHPISSIEVPTKNIVLNKQEIFEAYIINYETFEKHFNFKKNELVYFFYHTLDDCSSNRDPTYSILTNYKQTGNSKSNTLYKCSSILNKKLICKIHNNIQLCDQCIKSFPFNFLQSKLTKTLKGKQIISLLTLWNTDKQFVNAINNDDCGDLNFDIDNIIKFIGPIVIKIKRTCNNKWFYQKILSELKFFGYEKNTFGWDIELEKGNSFFFEDKYSNKSEGSNLLDLINTYHLPIHKNIWYTKEYKALETLATNYNFIIANEQ